MESGEVGIGPPHAADASDEVRGVAMETSVAGGAMADAALEAAAALEHLSHAPDSAAPGLWQNRDFKILLGGQSISAFGDAISFTALPLLVIALTGSGLAMGTVGVLQTLPDLLIGLPAGALADRWDRRRMMLYADLGRALLTALIPLSVILGLPTMGVILLVTFPINALRVLFLAGWTAAVPTLVGRDQVGRANGYAEAIFSLSFVVGPAIAGIMVSVIGPERTLFIDALSFLVSAISLWFIHRPMQEKRERRDSHLVAEIAEGMRYIAHERTLRVTIGFSGTVSVITAPLTAAVIFSLTIDQGRPPDVVGLVLSAFGLGYLVGAIVAGRYSKGPLGLLMLGGMTVTAFMIAAFALVPVPLVQAGAALLAGGAQALWLISYITVRGTITPDALLGRVGATARMISIGLQPVGLFVGGVLLDLIGGEETLLIVAAATLGVTLVFSTSRVLRQAVAGQGHPLTQPTGS